MKNAFLKMVQCLLFMVFFNPKSTAVIVLSGTNPKFVKAALNLIKAFKDKGIEVVVITSGFRTFLKLLLSGYFSIPMFVTASHFLGGNRGGLGEDQYYIDAYEKFTDYIRRRTVGKKVNHVILIPHWSYLSYALLAIAEQRLWTTHSLPVVSVAPKVSSIIGWEHIDYVYCYGEQCKSAFETIGHTKPLVMIGNVIYSKDDFVASGDSVGILIATSRIDKKENNWIERVLQYCSKKRMPCTICVHPSFSKDMYKDLMRPYKKFTKLIQVPDIFPILKKISLCITDCSSVGAEAIIFNKYLLTVNMTGKKFLCNRYGDYGVAIEVNHPEGIEPSLDSILFDKTVQQKLKEKYEDFYHYYNFKNDGMAAERLVNVISER